MIRQLDKQTSKANCRNKPTKQILTTCRLSDKIRSFHSHNQLPQIVIYSWLQLFFPMIYNKRCEEILAGARNRYGVEVDSPDVVAMETSTARRPAVAAEKESATAVGGRGAEESTYAQWQRGRRRRARPRRRATAEEEVSAAVVMGSGGVESMRGTMPGVRRSGLFPRGKPARSGW